MNCLVLVRVDDRAEGGARWVVSPGVVARAGGVGSSWSGRIIRWRHRQSLQIALRRATLLARGKEGLWVKNESVRHRNNIQLRATQRNIWVSCDNSLDRRRMHRMGEPLQFPPLRPCGCRQTLSMVSTQDRRHHQTTHRCRRVAVLPRGARSCARKNAKLDNGVTYTSDAIGIPLAVAVSLNRPIMKHSRIPLRRQARQVARLFHSRCRGGNGR